MCIYKYTRVYTGCMAVPIFRFPSYTVKRGKLDFEENLTLYIRVWRWIESNERAKKFWNGHVQ